jgi:uncharacterized protein (TIGR02246 family)
MRCISLLSILVALLVGPLMAISIAQNIGAPEDEEAIKSLMVEMTNGFNNHDAKAATRMYAPDGDFVSVRGEAANGATDVEGKLAAILATRAKSASLRTLKMKIRFVRPDVALVHVTNELGGLVNANGQTLPAHQELSLRVLVKESDGAWRLTAFQNTLVAPFDGSTPPK